MSFETPIMRDVSKLFGMIGLGIIIAFGAILFVAFVMPEIGFQMRAYEVGFNPCERVGDAYYKYNEEGDLIHSMGSSAGWDHGNYRLCNTMEEFYLLVGLGLFAFGLTIANIILWKKWRNL